jgi:hypothetical protein
MQSGWNGYTGVPNRLRVATAVTLPLGWRIALVRAGTAFWNEKGGPRVSQLCGNI